MNSSPLIRSGTSSHIGMVREENQDCAGRFPDKAELSTAPEHLFVVADGMGGHRGGREASRMAVDRIGRHFFTQKDSLPRRLTTAVILANEEIYSMSREDSDLEGMGTTVVALVVSGQFASFAHVGDSRIYHIRGGAIQQLTSDHTHVAEMERRGLLTTEQARTHPARSQLYRALGIQPHVDIDIVGEIPIQSGDMFVLCTDGLTSMVTADEIKDIAMSKPPQDACDDLVALANLRGGYDNVTIQVLQIE